MNRVSLFVLCIFTLASCTSAPVSTVEKNESSSAGLPVISLHYNGYIYQDDSLGDAWFLKAQDDGPIIDLSFEKMKECTRETTSEPCTIQDLIEGMTLEVSGSGTIDSNLVRTNMDVISARIIGTSLTFSEIGDVSDEPDGKWRITYTQKGTTKTMLIQLGHNTVCSDGGETKVCGTWMEKRHGAVYGEIRKGEDVIHATWINLP